MDLVLPCEIAGVLGIVLFLYTFRAGITDFIYLALKNWKVSAFVVVCMAGGLAGGVYASGESRAFEIPSFALPLPLDDPGVAVIDSCKDFITAKAEHRAGYVDPKPSMSDYVMMGAHSYWDTCAQTFGMNYWKQDISINGKNGGQMLCRTYLQDNYRSGIVDSWCATVLAPPATIVVGPAAPGATKAPDVQKASDHVYSRGKAG